MHINETRCPTAAVVMLSIAGQLTLSAPGLAQTAPVSEISANGTVRVCDANGDNIDSDGDQYGLEGDGYLVGPPEDFVESGYSCRGRPQSFDVIQLADPLGQFNRGYRMLSRVEIDVDFEVGSTDVIGKAALTRQVCFFGLPAAPLTRGLPRVTVLARALGERSIPQTRCIDDQGGTAPTTGACSSAVGRFGGVGGSGFTNKNGKVLSPFVFTELDRPSLIERNGWMYLTKVGRMIPGMGGLYLDAGLTGTVLTQVGATPTGRAFGEMRFYVETESWIQHAACPALDGGASVDFSMAPELLPKPVWWIEAGDAIPDDFTLAISPPTGPMTLPQQFDLSIVAATGGAAMTGISGTIDGLDVSGPLAACLQPTAALSGVQGGILTCRGLSGGFLAGIFGVGAHTMNVSMALSDGRVITDSATWTIHP